MTGTNGPMASRNSTTSRLSEQIRSVNSSRAGENTHRFRSVRSVRTGAHRSRRNSAVSLPPAVLEASPAGRPARL
jgi:hypothetical protein